MNRQSHDIRARTIRRVLVVVLALTAVSAMFIYVHYRRDLNDARERLDGGGRVVQTRCGPIEYSEEGNGKAILSVHAARIPHARFARQEFGGHFVYVRNAVLREIKAFIE